MGYGRYTPEEEAAMAQEKETCYRRWKQDVVSKAVRWINSATSQRERDRRRELTKQRLGEEAYAEVIKRI